MSTSRILDEFLDQPPMRERIVAVRTADQSLLTNVPHLVVHHSPLGYEWGYGGSGPSDFALNIAENMLRLMDHEGPLMEGRTFDRYRLFRAAWELHQPLKAQFVVGLPRDVGIYSLLYEDVRAWIAAQLDAPEAS